MAERDADGVLPPSPLAPPRAAAALRCQECDAALQPAPSPSPSLLRSSFVVMTRRGGDLSAPPTPQAPAEPPAAPPTHRHEQMQRLAHALPVRASVFRVCVPSPIPEPSPQQHTQRHTHTHTHTGAHAQDVEPACWDAPCVRSESGAEYVFPFHVPRLCAPCARALTIALETRRQGLDEAARAVAAQRSALLVAHAQPARDTDLRSSFIAEDSSTGTETGTCDGGGCGDGEEEEEEEEGALREAEEEERALRAAVAAAEREAARLGAARAALETAEARLHAAECAHWRAYARHTARLQCAADALQHAQAAAAARAATERRFARARDAPAALAAIQSPAALAASSSVPAAPPLFVFPPCWSSSGDSSSEHVATIRGYRLGVVAGVAPEELNEALGHAAFVLATLAGRLAHRLALCQLRSLGARSTVQLRAHAPVHPLYTLTDLRFADASSSAAPSSSSTSSSTSETRPRSNSQLMRWLTLSPRAPEPPQTPQQQAGGAEGSFEEGLVLLLACLDELVQHCVRLHPQVRIPVTVCRDAIRWKQEPFCSVRPSAAGREAWNHAMLVLLLALHRIALQLRPLTAALRQPRSPLPRMTTTTTAPAAATTAAAGLDVTAVQPHL